MARDNFRPVETKFVSDDEIHVIKDGKLFILQAYEDNKWMFEMYTGQLDRKSSSYACIMSYCRRNGVEQTYYKDSGQRWFVGPFSELVRLISLHSFKAFYTQYNEEIK